MVFIQAQIALRYLVIRIKLLNAQHEFAPPDPVEFVSLKLKMGNFCVKEEIRSMNNAHNKVSKVLFNEGVIYRTHLF